MQIDEIKYFLNNMFSNHNEFQSVNGLKNSTNLDYMLVADAVSEHIDMFTNIIAQELNMLKNHIPTPSTIEYNFPKTI